jgi:hypothetical protein
MQVWYYVVCSGIVVLASLSFSISRHRASAVSCLAEWYMTYAGSDAGSKSYYNRSNRDHT